MDHLWAANQLRVFTIKIDQLAELEATDLIERIATQETGSVSAVSVADELLSLDPVMRDIMNAARSGPITRSQREDRQRQGHVDQLQNQERG
jgi:hypothetical protein